MPSGCCNLNLGPFCYRRWTLMTIWNVKFATMWCEFHHKLAWIVHRASTSGTTVLNEDIQRSVTIWCPVGSVMSDLWMLSRKLIRSDAHHPVLFCFPPVLPPNRPKKEKKPIYGSVGDRSGLLARVKHFLVWWQICSVVEQSGTLDLLHEVDA